MRSEALETRVLEYRCVLPQPPLSGDFVTFQFSWAEIGAEKWRSVKRSRRFETLAKTLMMMPRRFAPVAVLLVRAILRAIASRRACRSRRLWQVRGRYSVLSYRGAAMIDKM